MGIYDDIARIARMERALRRGMTRRERIEDDLEQEWYTVPEAAPIIRLSTKRLYALIREGHLEASEPTPRGKLIHYTDLAKFLSKKGGKKSE